MLERLRSQAKMYVIGSASARRANSADSSAASARKRTRSRGRRTRPRSQRIDGFRAREHGKDQIAVSASDIGESGLAHPCELLADSRGQVMFHPLHRRSE